MRHAGRPASSTAGGDTSRPTECRTRFSSSPKSRSSITSPTNSQPTRLLPRRSTKRPVRLLRNTLSRPSRPQGRRNLHRKAKHRVRPISLPICMAHQPREQDTRRFSKSIVKMEYLGTKCDKNLCIGITKQDKNLMGMMGQKSFRTRGLRGELVNKPVVEKKSPMEK